MPQPAIAKERQRPVTHPGRCAGIGQARPEPAVLENVQAAVLADRGQLADGSCRDVACKDAPACVEAEVARRAHIRLLLEFQARHAQRPDDAARKRDEEAACAPDTAEPIADLVGCGERRRLDVGRGRDGRRLGLGLCGRLGIGAVPERVDPRRERYRRDDDHDEHGDAPPHATRIRRTAR